jgi:hypothetical protein
MADHSEQINILIDILKQIIAAQNRRLELQEEIHRIMVKKTDRLQSELRSALESLRQLEEMND